jgi:hypothetical protein
MSRLLVPQPWQLVGYILTLKSKGPNIYIHGESLKEAVQAKHGESLKEAMQASMVRVIGDVVCHFNKFRFDCSKS